MTGRDRTVIIVVAVAAVLAAAWFLVISPKRDQASALQSQINSVQSSLNSARAQMAQAEVARQAFHKNYATLVRLGEAVPTDDDVPSLIYQIQTAASKAGVNFQGLTVNSSGASAAPNVAVPATSSSTTSSSTASTPPASTTPPASGAAATATTLPPGAVIGPANFPVEPFTFTFEGNFFHLSNFFARLQRFVVATARQLAVSGRLMNLEAINLAPASGGFPEIQATVSATTYLLPASQGLLDGASPSGPAAATPQQASTSGSSVAAPAVVTPGGGG